MQCGVNARVTVTGDVQREGRGGGGGGGGGNVRASDRCGRELDKEGEDGCARWLGFRQGGYRVRGTNWLSLALKTGQRRDVTKRNFANVATFGQRRDIPENDTKQRRDVGYQRRDVPETYKNPRRDVDISHRDVPERFKINVATLGTHVATFQMA